MQRILLILLLFPFLTTAQVVTTPSHPGIKIIFEDDFSSDSIGKFPKHWRAYPALMNQDLNDAMVTTDGGLITVRSVNGEHVLDVHSHHNNIPLWPNLDTTSYLTDTFNVEFDGIIENEDNDIATIFYDKNGNYIFYIRVFGNRQIMSVLSINPDDLSYTTCPDKFKFNVWHHYTYAYRNQSVNLYIDEDRVCTIPDCSYPPANMAIAGNTNIHGDPYVRFSNFKISTGDIGNELNTILTEKKFTTHAIHFEVNKSTILPSRKGFILELAAWLKQNPSVKLEIDGHTDSDGNDQANLKLSQDRANEVMAQLIRYGIAKSRLTAKGFGATKPLQPNDTPEAKENNRRVEFIKMPD